MPPQSPAQPPTPEQNLFRLRSTQKQFQEASILAAIDTTALQLFTFYKKVDVLRDQRAILSKFGQILRANSCSIAYKAAARAPELFTPEKSKVYRLFVSAILASFRLSPIEGRHVLPMGHRYHVIEQPPESAEFATTALQSWTLLRTDVQVVLSGQVVITVSAQRSMTPLATVDNVVQQLSGGDTSATRITPVALAPSGQLAVCRNGFIGHPESDTHNLTPHQKAQLDMWQKLFVDWAERNTSVHVKDDDLWVELFIPVQEQTFAGNSESPTGKKPEPKHTMSLKSFYWPAKLCFTINVANGQTQLSIEPEVSHDPVQFIIEWFETLGSGDYGLQTTLDEAKADSDDDPIFADDGPFDNPEVFQPFGGPPAFPTSQTVYPTPPDAIMTHATPAMSAVDGLAATPLTANRMTTEATPGAQDHQQPNVEENAQESGGTGLYGDDLFDDMPDDAFDQESGAEEPNWDFFDKPGQVDEREEQSAPQDADAMDTTAPEDAQQHDADNHDREGSQQVQAQTDEDLQHMAAASDEITDTSQHDEGISKESPDIRRTSGSASTGKDANVNSSVSRRRSSVFDAVKESRPDQGRDHRYSASGPYFFGEAPVTANVSQARGLGQWLQRSPSISTASGSDSDDDSSLSGNSPDALQVATPDHDPDDVAMLDAVPMEGVKPDLDGIEIDAHIVFDLVSVLHTRASLEDAVAIGKPDGLPAKFDKPQIRNEFAFELVRQLTQTCLLRDTYGTGSIQIDSKHRNEVVLLSGATAETMTYSSLIHLQGVIANSTGKSAAGRMSRLDEPDIAMSRLDKAITSRLSVLPFWDILGLQPASKAKDVAALCIHPRITGMEDSCSHFLDRMAEAYTTCGLGQHSRGTIDGITNNGLIVAEAGDNGMFLGPMRKVAEALTHESRQGGSLIIYIVAQSQQAMAYVYASIASYAIRRHVGQGWAKRTERLDLVFQVIPPDFVSLPNEIVVPAQSDYNALALGIFSQVPPDQEDLPPGRCDYPLILADGRDSINFGLDSSSAWPLSQDNVLHLAYAYSEDNRWLLATWTDSKGLLALWMPYELKTLVLGPTRAVDEVIKDIWAVSTELMSKQRARWRLVVAKTGTYEAPEINAWMSAVNNQVNNGKARCNLVLLSVELTPTFRLFPQIEQVRTAQQAYGTPASTPGVTSPEQMVVATPTSGSMVLNAPTPPEHSFDPNVDGDLSITDPIEASWAVVLPFGLNQAKDILEMRPAVASGYLAKKSGSKDDDGLTLLGVHMIWPTPDPAVNTPGQREKELEDYLRDYRGLVTLAAARGCIDQATSCIPWHIHTAVSGATALGRLI